jgi:hypothetical protein
VTKPKATQTKAKGKADKKLPTPARPRGRPSKYAIELCDEIVTRIADGEPLRQICRDEHMPQWGAVYRWEQEHQEFKERIAHARILGEEAISQECMYIADELPERTAMGGVDSGDIQHKKLRIETRLKLLAKWNPRKWGDKVDVNHGGQQENPLTMLVSSLGGNVIGKTKHDE